MIRGLLFIFAGILMLSSMDASARLIEKYCPIQCDPTDGSDRSVRSIVDSVRTTLKQGDQLRIFDTWEGSRRFYATWTYSNGSLFMTDTGYAVVADTGGGGGGGGGGGNGGSGGANPPGGCYGNCGGGGDWGGSCSSIIGGRETGCVIGSGPPAERDDR